MFTINIAPGAIVINQDSRELPGVLNRLTALEATLETMRAKLDTLVPDASQVAQLANQLRASTDNLKQVVDSVSSSTSTQEK